jgi:hypothetical protein
VLPIAIAYLYWRSSCRVVAGRQAGFVIGAILAAFGVQLIGFGLIGEIIIFTQAPNLRDYKVEDIVEGGAGDRAEAPSRSRARGGRTGP